MEINMFSMLVGLVCLIPGTFFAFLAKKRIYRSNKGVFITEPLAYVFFLFWAFVLSTAGFIWILYWFLPESTTSNFDHLWKIFGYSFIGSLITTLTISFLILTWKIQEGEEGGDGESEDQNE
jgi:hypothetical protein